MNIVKTLEGHDLKVTEARQKLLEIMEKIDKPVDAPFLIEQMQAFGTDRVTVFRILNILTEHDILRKLEFGEGKSRYEINTDEHHHLVCTNCKAIESVSVCNIDMLLQEIKKQSKFLVTSHETEFFGFCEKCQMKKK